MLVCAETPSGAPDVVARRKATAVVVEDDPVVAGLLEAILSVEGFAVTVASDGYAARTLFSSPRPADVVLLDWMLPHASGIELLNQLRSRPELSGVPVIMLTGRVGERDAVRAFAAGADDFVAKPFGPAELVARVRRLVGRSAVRSAEPSALVSAS